MTNNTKRRAVERVRALELDIQRAERYTFWSSELNKYVTYLELQKELKKARAQANQWTTT